MKRTALVCVAKNEDRYIAEWLKYNLAFGFDKIFVYQNDWRCTNKEALSIDNVEWLEFDGKKRQIAAYNDFIQKHYADFDWVAFFDCDEFLVLKNHSFKWWLCQAGKYYGIAVNWKLFGNNNIENDDGSFGVLNRFTMRAALCNKHIKTILHLSKCYKENMRNVRFVENPHNTTISASNSKSEHVVATDFNTFVNGPFNENYNDDNAFLAHFYCKTYKEFLDVKVARGRADIGVPCKIESYKSYNINEIEDAWLRDFYNQKCLSI